MSEEVYGYVIIYGDEIRSDIDEDDSDIGVVRRYRIALSNWKAAGNPLRTDDRIAEIYDGKCVPCEHFRKAPLVDKGQCNLCKCLISRTGVNLNKLAWATEACPDVPPRWNRDS